MTDVDPAVVEAVYNAPCIFSGPERRTCDHQLLKHPECAIAAADRARADQGLVVVRRDLLTEAADELNRWGHGDFHYGDQPQDPAVVAMVARLRAVLHGTDEGAT